jgi:uncharacterized protein (DUF433 family)
VTRRLEYLDEALDEAKEAARWYAERSLTAAGHDRGNLPDMGQMIVSCSPDVLGGTPVFNGTRVPVQTLLDYLEAGETIDDFLAGFPTVTREQVVAFFEEAKARMVASAS